MLGQTLAQMDAGIATVSDDVGLEMPSSITNSSRSCG
jgi:hypothetical protein